MIVKLGSLISEYSVRNKADEDIPVYSVTIEQGFCTGYFSKEVASQDRTTYKIVPRGCFAYNPSRINVGSVDVQECEDRVIVSPLYVVFSVDEKLNRRYLLHYLKSDITLTYIKAYASGSVRDNLKFSILKDFPINLPSAEEQGQIVATLDGIEHLIALRKEEIASLDELVKSRFIELFGDLASPDCKWETKKLVETCVAADDIKCGPFGTQLSKDEYVDSGVAVWEIPQINSLFATLPTHYLTEEKAKELDAYSIKAGDIAMSRKGNVGKCAVFPISFASGIIHSDVLRIRVDGSQVLPLFMMHQLHYSGSVQHQIELVSAGAIMAGINVTKLKQISVHIPPMRLQQQFVAFVEQTDKSRFIELFGDPIANQFGWDTTNIGAIVTEVRYGTSRPAVENGKYPYLRMNNLTFDGHLDLKDLKRIDIPEEEIEKCIVRKGDVLFNRTNSVELVGKTCVFDLDEEMVIAGYIIRVRLGQKMIPTVFSAFMNSQPIKELFRGMAKGAVNQANINAQELQSIRIYLPPIDLQEQFAAFVEQTDKSKYFACQTLSFLLKLANNLQSWREKQYDY